MNEVEYYQNILSKFQANQSAQIGEGTFGVIYKGFSQQLNSSVAIKIFKKKEHRNSQYLNQFINEAQKVASITHPNIIRIYENNTKDYYFVMRLLDETLSDKLHDRGDMLIEGKVIRLAIEISEALCELATQEKYEGWENERRKNIVHRDLKPSNIMFDPNDNAVLTDFGISVFDDEIPTEIAGTPIYMSPEQFEDGQKLDCRSDMYSLGVILYQISTGKLPFEGTNFQQLKDKHQHEPPIPPSEHYSLLNKDLEKAILKLLQKKPEQRYLSPHSLLQDLKYIKEKIKDESEKKYFKLREKNDLDNAKLICEDYLNNVDPNDQLFRSELSKVSIKILMKNAKQDIIALDIEKALERIKEIESSLGRDTDKEYPELKGNIQLVNKHFHELLSDIKKEDIAAAWKNYEKIKRIISSENEEKHSINKLVRYENLLSILERAQKQYETKEYSSALEEYSKAKHLDEDEFDFIDTKIEKIKREIECLDTKLKKTEALIEKHKNTGKIDALRGKLKIINESSKRYDLDATQNLNTIYYKLLVIDSLEHKNNKKFQNALDSIKKAQKYCNSESIRVIILLLELFNFEKKEQYAVASRHCEQLLEMLQNSDSVDLSEQFAEIAKEYNNSYLEAKREELRYKSAIDKELAIVDRHIRNRKMTSAITTLKEIEKKLNQKRKQDDKIDLSQFDSRILALRERIKNNNFEEIVPTPPSTIPNGRPPKPKPPVPRISKKFILILAAIFLTAILIWKSPLIIGSIKKWTPKPFHDVYAEFSIESVPAKSTLYIDGSLQPLELNSDLVQDSLAAGEHTFLLQNPRFNDTTFTAKISPDSPNLFSLAEWSLAKIKVELAINPTPDHVIANGRALKSTTDTFSFIAHPGQTTVHISKNGFETKAFNLQLKKGDAVKRTIELIPVPPGSLRITIYPYATIRLDDQTSATDTIKLEKDSFPAGFHTLELIHPSYGMFETRIEIQSGVENTFAFNLEGECGEFVITVLDENDQKTFANIFIDGKIAARQQDFLKIKKLPGNYQISAEKEGYDRAASTLSANVVKGQLTRINIKLKK